MKKRLIQGIISIAILSIIIIAISSYFISNTNIIGPIFIGLGLINILFLNYYKISFKSIYPDFIFGFIDNSILVLAAIIGGAYAGITGAVIGGAAGNTITDGIGGLFEGHYAQELNKKKIKTTRDPISASLGKMAGCLFGAGIGLILVYVKNLIF
jgi:hypothetical protein